MKESYCGICDECQLGAPDFLEALATVKTYLGRFRVNWWAHCFPGDEGFSLSEFRKGLDWFLAHQDCPGCRGGKGLDRCPVRLCALRKNVSHCFACQDLKDCDKFAFLLAEFPDLKTRLRRRQLKYQARELLLGNP